MNAMAAIDLMGGLAALEAELARQLSLIGHGGADWTRPRAHPEGHVHDVVIVGGGQSGLAAAFGLLRERVSNILVIDENPAGFEGPWDTYARMITLRTPKDAQPRSTTACPTLTFRAFWEAQHGAEGWSGARQDPAPRLDGLPALVSPRAGASPFATEREGRAGSSRWWTACISVQAWRSGRSCSWPERSSSPPAFRAAANGTRLNSSSSDALHPPVVGPHLSRADRLRRHSPASRIAHPGRRRVGLRQRPRMR